jgi:DNA-binding PadR family transcriptional regulator
MALDHILLGLLRTPASGYELRRAFTENIRHFWSAELSQIYPTLQRLERRGLLRSRAEPSPKGPARRVYSLTAKGRKHLDRWLRLDPVMGTERFEYLAQLYFMDELGDFAETRRFMEELRTRLATWLAELKRIEDGALQQIRAHQGQISPSGFHRYAALRMGLLSIAAKIVWCDETLASLEQGLAAEGAPPHPDPLPRAGGAGNTASERKTGT